MSTPDETGSLRRWGFRGSIAALVIYWLVLVTATHLPRVPEPLGFRPSDKLVHLAAYAVLGALVALVYCLHRRPRPWLAAVLLAALAAHGAVDEATQPLFGRHADVADWCADVMGAALGLGLVLAIATLVRPRAGESQS